MESSEHNKLKNNTETEAGKHTPDSCQRAVFKLCVVFGQLQTWQPSILVPVLVIADHHLPDLMTPESVILIISNKATVYHIIE